MPAPAAETRACKQAGVDPTLADVGLIDYHPTHDCPRFRLATQYIQDHE